jgi:DNA-binding NtrC family response regulator
MRMKYRWLNAQSKKNDSALDCQPDSGQVLEQPTVLIVDDDRLIRVMLQLGLAHYGFNILLARDGWEAIELFQLHKDDIAVVLLDVCMPGLDGPKTMNKLRAIDPQVHVCLMSGDTGFYDPDFLRRYGANGFIAKPFMMDKLAETLHQLVLSEVDILFGQRIQEEQIGGVARQFNTVATQATCDSPG